MITTVFGDEVMVLMKLIDGRSFDEAEAGPLDAGAGADDTVDITRGESAWLGVAAAGCDGGGGGPDADTIGGLTNWYCCGGGNEGRAELVALVA